MRSPVTPAMKTYMAPTGLVSSAQNPKTSGTGIVVRDLMYFMVEISLSSSALDLYECGFLLNSGIGAGGRGGR